MTAAREISSVPNEQSALALTFDDGPAEWTELILDTLREAAVRSTFFILGESIPGRESTLKRAFAEGHEIGNHSLSHPSLRQVAPTEIRREITAAGRMINDVIGQPPTVFRPPYFHSSPAVQEAAGACGFEWVVQASVWVPDWSEESAEVITHGVINHPELRSGAIIDLHDGRPPREPIASSRSDRVSTVGAVRQIVPALVERGFTFLTVSELLALN